MRELTEEERAHMGGVMDDRFGASHLAVGRETEFEAGYLAARSFDAERVVPVSSEPAPFDDERSLVLESVPAREIVKDDEIMCSDLVRRVHDVKPYVPEVGGFSFNFGDRWQAFEDAQPVWRVVPARPVVEASGEREAVTTAHRVMERDGEVVVEPPIRPGFTIYIDRRQFAVRGATVSERDLRSLPSPPIPDDSAIWLEQPNEDVQVGATSISLRGGERFYTTPNTITAGASTRVPDETAGDGHDCGGWERDHDGVMMCPVCGRHPGDDLEDRDDVPADFRAEMRLALDEAWAAASRVPSAPDDLVSVLARDLRAGDEVLLRVDQVLAADGGRVALVGVEMGPFLGEQQILRARHPDGS